MGTTPEEIRREAAACDERKFRQAERMSPAERFFAGAELFDYDCEITKAGLRNENPGWSDAEIITELRRLVHFQSKRGR